MKNISLFMNIERDSMPISQVWSWWWNAYNCILHFRYSTLTLSTPLFIFICAAYDVQLELPKQSVGVAPSLISDKI